METHMPQSKPLTSDVKLIGLPWLNGTMCSLFYLDKGSEVLVVQSCLIPYEPTDYIACQSPLPMGFPREEFLSGLPFPSPGDLPDPAIELRSSALAGEPPQKSQYYV